MGKTHLLSVSVGLTVLLMIAIATALVGMLSTPYEVTRIRNALLADVGEASDFVWDADHTPDGFLLERSATPAMFVKIVSEILGPNGDVRSDWENALGIARHLAQGPGPGGGGILSNTHYAYQILMTEKRGYCADYTQVFNGLARAADIPVREWGMSFDGFGGDGHAFNEIYDKRLGKWIFVDSFYSFYVEDAKTRLPLSALEFRKRLRDEDSLRGFSVKPIDPLQFRFRNAEKAISYYQRGADQFFLWFGNNVFSYDNHPVVRALGPVSRSLEQGAAILAGIHPGIRIIKTETNTTLIDGLFEKRNWFFSGVFVLFVLAVGLLLEIRTYSRIRKLHARTPI